MSGKIDQIKQKLGFQGPEATNSDVCEFSIQSKELPEGWGGWCCNRPVWNDEDRCIWHAKTFNKSTEEIREALKVENRHPHKYSHLMPVRRLDGAHLRSIDTSIENEEGLSFSLPFGGNTLFKSNFDNSDLTGASFDKAMMSDSSLRECDLNHVLLQQSEFANVNLEYADLTGTHCIWVDFSESNLTGVYFSRANLFNADLEDADLTNAKLEEARLMEADLKGANLEKANLENVDLRDADLKKARLHEARLRNVRLNEGTKFGEVCIYELESDRDAEQRDIETSNAGKQESSYQDRVRYAARRFRNRTAKSENDGDKLKKAVRIYRLYQRLLREAALPADIRHYRIRERHARRKLALEKGNYLKWANFSLQRWFTLYGESPWRVIYTSAGIIFLWTFLYPAAGGVTSSVDVGGSGLISAWLGRLYFSVVTFTTLGFGDIQPATRLAQALAGAEAFLGALLMALLVFVLGRRTTW